MEKVVIFGNSSFAQLVYYYLLNDSVFDIMGFTVDSEYIKEDQFCNLPVFPYEKIEEQYPPSEYKMFIAIGYSVVNTIRAQKYHDAKKKGYQLISYIGSKVNYWPDLKIGENCFIHENPTIQPFVEIGNNVIINGSSYIAHDSFIKDHCYIAGSACIGGMVTIEPYCFVGMNTTIKDHVIIRKMGIIGQGSVVNSDTDEKGVYSGNPAKKIYHNSLKVKI
ncbi:transferase hexapeptide repeat [Methanospirillum hungatei JF-1]|uniref:Transferase hexapeptide repeat n=1 Tax=Methanospirillum hungatei JF-1 (strain ATCC 27890 / DSM 864 / NBRC 100397 / JF-1) TaxID=323259 RepID=Q2FUK0_METHJ|nr:acetyltransferase [Methanospirillum hungatei]ABD42805.1 transferase hexapeptide repeat [Methanospirillum hungatei JF-1]